MYASIREKDGWENWHMIEICDYPCNNKREAELEEDKYMTELKANMNMIRASRTQKQYYEDNREKRKEYRVNNKEKIQEYEKEYRETNKEKIKEKEKQYREDNKHKINEKITCKCGTVVLKRDLKRHEKTKKHTDLINLIQ